MTRAATVALEDVQATRYSKPRKVKDVFSDRTGVCGLCGCGLGKRYTREQRRAHEKGSQHLHNHQRYLELFGPAREARWLRLQEEYKIKEQFDRKDMVRKLQMELHTTDWIEHGDATRLKAALWDAMADPVNIPSVAEVLEVQKNVTRSSLVERAVTIALAGDTSGAFVVSHLLAQRHGG